MKYDYVLNLVNQYHTNYADFVEEIFDGALPKALEFTILKMVRTGDYSKYPHEFKMLGLSLDYLYTNCRWEV